MREWTTFEGLKNFGTWFKRTRYDASVWPSNLKIWFETTTGFETKLTQQELCEWLSVASDDENISDYLYRIKIIESWAESKSMDDVRVKNIKESNLLIAIAQSGFLSMRTSSGDMRPVFPSDIWIFREVLKGKINPITDRYPIKPIGRGAGPSVRSFLDGLTYASRGASIQDLVVRMDFATGDDRWTEKDITPGSWFDDLLQGKINDLELYDLDRLAQTIQAYMRRYTKSSASFDLSDLLAIISRDRGATPMLEPSKLPKSFIGRVVCQYCLGRNIDYKSFVEENLCIKLDRWEQIENGSKPTSGEYESLAFELERPVKFFQDAWSTDPNALSSYHMDPQRSEVV